MQKVLISFLVIFSLLCSWYWGLQIPSWAVGILGVISGLVSADLWLKSVKEEHNKKYNILAAVMSAAAVSFSLNIISFGPVNGKFAIYICKIILFIKLVALGYGLLFMFSTFLCLLPFSFGDYFWNILYKNVLKNK
ncbi:Hypothetical protein GbCGDNIH3_7034 [Granulibacter bethesdensis]|uniref:Uncharacterized protein n=1 Tax=Granulibacter bethesdensis TaxID=364410 RepID=A0AAN0VFZ3_9PROT|nr:hypothetical protein [Granulibacter bethesdensis]AHJ63280.1 Hypothetical protein GbCGDNIH3_7034 [Granulibacter bethesdensis]